MQKSKWLNAPNIISLSRIFIGLAIFFLLIKGNMLPSIILYILGALTDGLDGQIARKLKKTTKIGSFVDALADRIFIILILIGLVIFGKLNYYFVLIIFLAWAAGEVVIGLMITKKIKQFYLYSVHRNSIRAAAFFVFIAMGWTLARFPGLEILFWITILFMLFALIDYLIWFSGKKWMAYEILQNKLKKGFLGKLME